MADTIPARAARAVEMLSLEGHESVLEIGCGRGAAVWLACPRLRGGSITAIDRSTAAIAAARRRNEPWIAAGRAAFHAAAIEAFDGKPQAFDVIFAVNVNVFWLEAGPALAAVRRLMSAGGRLVLYYEAPSPSQRDSIARDVRERLAAAGFRTCAFDDASDDPRQWGVAARLVA